MHGLCLSGCGGDCQCLMHAMTCFTLCVVRVCQGAEGTVNDACDDLMCMVRVCQSVEVTVSVNDACDDLFHVVHGPCLSGCGGDCQ